MEHLGKAHDFVEKRKEKSSSTLISLVSFSIIRVQQATPLTKIVLFCPFCIRNGPLLRAAYMASPDMPLPQQSALYREQIEPRRVSQRC